LIADSVPSFLPAAGASLINLGRLSTLSAHGDLAKCEVYVQLWVSEDFACAVSFGEVAVNRVPECDHIKIHVEASPPISYAKDTSTPSAAICAR